MKQFILLSLLVLVFQLHAQSQAREENVDYNKKKQQAFVIDFAYPPEAVENAIVHRMEKLGYRAKEEKGLFNKDKGYRIYKGAQIDDVYDGSLDYIIRVDRKSRKETDESVVYMILHKDGENVKAIFDEDDRRAAKSFLSGLLPDVEDAHLDLQVKSQEDVLTKSEKKYKSLQDEQLSLEKKLAELQAAIEKNKLGQEDQLKTVELNKSALEELKGKRRKSTR